MSSEDKLRVFLSAPLLLPDVHRSAELSRIIEEAIGDQVGAIDIHTHGITDEQLRAADTSLYQNIRRADLVIADITGNNPNVLYEIGYAHALRKPVILLADTTTTEVPFDLAGHLVILNDPNRPSDLQRSIRLAVDRYLPVAAK